MPDPDTVCQPLLELGDLRAEDELPVIEDPLDAGVDRVAELAVLGLEVDEVHGVALRPAGGVSPRSRSPARGRELGTSRLVSPPTRVLVPGRQDCRSGPFRRIEVRIEGGIVV